MKTNKLSKLMKRAAVAAMSAVMLLSFAACGAKSSAPADTGSGAPTQTQTQTGNQNQGQNQNQTPDTTVTEYKVAIVKFMDHASLDLIDSNIKKELDALSAELGVNFNYQDYSYNGQGDSTTLQQIAAQLLEKEVDVVVPIATPAAQVMQSVVTEAGIPIIFSAISDPVTAKLVDTLEVPGGTITGVSDALNTEMIMKLMVALNPGLDNVGLLYSKSEDSSKRPIEEAKAYMDAKGISYVEKTGTNPDEISSAVDALIAAGVKTIFTPTDNTVMSSELAIFEKLNDAGIQHYTGANSFALNGAFFGYGVDYNDLGAQTAKMVADLLVDGKDPATTPVVILAHEAATINTETCEAIGLTLNQVKDAFGTLGIGVEEIQTAKSFE